MEQPIDPSELKARGAFFMTGLSRASMGKGFGAFLARHPVNLTVDRLILFSINLSLSPPSFVVQSEYSLCHLPVPLGAKIVVQD
jgi:hypothetical protein